MRSEEKPCKETLEKWHKDPNNWKWGMFYFNKEDHRILPPKRIEWMGWTVNFANPRSIIAFLIAIAFFYFGSNFNRTQKVSQEKIIPLIYESNKPK